MGFLNTLSTVRGRKNLEAVTGMLLLVFCVEHLLANSMLLLSNPEPYRWYTTQLGRAVATRCAEVLLFGLFITHIGMGLFMRYNHMKLLRRVPFIPKPASFSTRYVGWTGFAILVFLAVHLVTFFVPNRIQHIAGFDLYTQAHETFANPWYVLFYVLSMLALSSHLSHGIKSAVVSFKAIPPRKLPRIRKITGIVALVTPLALGYVAIHLLVASVTK